MADAARRLARWLALVLAVGACAVHTPRHVAASALLAVAIAATGARRSAIAVLGLLLLAGILGLRVDA